MSNYHLDMERMLCDKEYFLSIQAKLRSGALDPRLMSEAEAIIYGEADERFCDHKVRPLTDASFKGENYYAPEPSPQRLFWNILGRRLGF